jgi:hypothetical protein
VKGSLESFKVLLSDEGGTDIFMLEYIYQHTKVQWMAVTHMPNDWQIWMDAANKAMVIYSPACRFIFSADDPLAAESAPAEQKSEESLR